jgi:hypothetical protein
LPDGKKSLKGTINVLGLEPLEIDGLIDFPRGSKRSIFRKSKYTLEYSGIVIYLLLNKVLCLSCLHSEVISCVAALILVELSQDGFSIVLRDFQYPVAFVAYIHQMWNMIILIYKESYFCHPLTNVFPGISQPSYNHLCMKVQVIVSTNFETVGLVSLLLTRRNGRNVQVLEIVICAP